MLNHDDIVFVKSQNFIAVLSVCSSSCYKFKFIVCVSVSLGMHFCPVGFKLPTVMTQAGLWCLMERLQLLQCQPPAFLSDCHA